MMEYKGYTGRINGIDESQGQIHGEVEGIDDVITFEGKNLEELVQAFHDSVEDYLAFCAERSEAPEKPYSGKFLVRVSPTLHQRVVNAAKKEGESLNSWVASALEASLNRSLSSPTRKRSSPRKKTPRKPKENSRKAKTS